MSVQAHTGVLSAVGEGFAGQGNHHPQRPGSLCQAAGRSGYAFIINPSVTSSWFCKCLGSPGDSHLHLFPALPPRFLSLLLFTYFWGEHDVLNRQDPEAETGPALPLVVVNETPKINLRPRKQHLFCT